LGSVSSREEVLRQSSHGLIHLSSGMSLGNRREYALRQVHFLANVFGGFSFVNFESGPTSGGRWIGPTPVFRQHFVDLRHVSQSTAVPHRSGIPSDCPLAVGNW